MPPAYDSLLPLYDDKDLPKYNDVVGTAPVQEGCAESSTQESPPDYQTEPGSSSGSAQQS